MKETTLEYKQIYLKGFFPVKRAIKANFKEDITPNEYYNKYVTKVEDDETQKYERVMDLDTKRMQVFKIEEGWRYAVAVFPISKATKPSDIKTTIKKKK